MSAAQLRRWTSDGPMRRGLMVNEYRFLDGSNELSFLDLIELRVVDALRRGGISLQAIRFAMEFATRTLGTDRPLASVRFRTDGAEILMELPEDGRLMSLSRRRPGQGVLADIVRQSLRDLDFEDGRAARWRPSSGKGVVIDPERSFGEPIMEVSGISTRVLFQDFERINDARRVGAIYEVPPGAVRDAVRYERALDRA